MAVPNVDISGLEGETAPNLAGKSIGDFFSGDTGLVSIVFIFAGLALLLYFLLGGFQLMTSSGDPKKAESAKQTLTNALVGFVIVFIAYWLVQALGSILGIEAIKSIF